MRKFDTAVFYDIENLLKGYAFSPQTLSSLSLREILEGARGTGRIGGIAVQRAYANWSDPRLGMMRGEINELGIEPIQVFGFSKDAKKNAADIQLAIDAVDLAHVRPGIEVFVVVSGDGGFASLAKKLHEYGKTVIGCAYRTAANRTLISVCDEFVAIADPDELREPAASANGVAAASRPPQPAPPAPPAGSSASAASTGDLPGGYGSAMVARMSKSIKAITAADVGQAISKVREVLAWIEKDPGCARELKERGLHFSGVGEAIRFALQGAELPRVGFPKLVELLQFACAGTRLAVVRYTDATLALSWRNALPAGGEWLPDLPGDYLHSAPHYRSLLQVAPSPVLRLPDARELVAVASQVSRMAPRDKDLGTLLEDITQALEGRVTAESVKRALLCMVASAAFERTPATAPLPEQRLALQPGLEDERGRS